LKNTARESVKSLEKATTLQFRSAPATLSSTLLLRYAGECIH